MTVFLAYCALLIRTHVLRMIRLARIAESALARLHMSGCMALGTNAVRTRVRVARVSRRDAYRAVFRAVLVSCHMRIRTTVITNHAFDLNFPFVMLTAAAVTDPADDLPAVFRDPADGLSAAFLRPRCWTPDGETERAQAMD